MDRTITNRMSGPETGARLALLASAAIAGLALSGCATTSAPLAEVSYDKALVALEKGETSEAIAHAEAAVLAEPRNGRFRALLGAAYLDAGRYQSAATSFGDALELGDGDAKTVLSYALTQTAIGANKAALSELLEWERALDPADAGLALALAGNPERGVFVLTNALRAGHNTAKARQNLAYTYALAGNWRAARVMAAEDVPADQLDARLSQWAANAKPEDHMARVSTLLGIAPVSDGGMPAMLALSNFPSTEVMVAEAEAAKPVNAAPVQVAAAPGTKAAGAKAPGKPTQAEAMTFERDTAPAAWGAKNDVESVDPTVSRILAATGSQEAAKVAPAKVAPAKATPAPGAPVRTAKIVEPAGPRFVSRPVTQELPQRSAPAPTPAPQRVAAAEKSTPAPVAASMRGDTHLVQLGSYPSEADAKAGWTTLQRKFPQLSNHDVLITRAEVKGKIYYRVAAADFGKSGAAQMCSLARSNGVGCFAYTKNNPPAGALDKGTRIAAAR
jgi:tetratricopeptide (TPR) repeat protein